MEYAGFLRRFAATIIDCLILWIPSFFLGGGGNIPAFLGFGLFLGLAYKPIFESSILSATPGKALMGIVVVSETTGQRISFKSALIRYLTSYISFFVAYIGYLMQPFTTRRQTLHDMVAETVVIMKESPDLNYFVVWRDQVKDVLNKL
ncbi:MAG: RDD family protein [Bdellovibrio sp.]|nr:RDD family protein [Bdellovibrio sp.]